MLDVQQRTKQEFIAYWNMDIKVQRFDFLPPGDHIFVLDIFVFLTVPSVTKSCRPFHPLRIHFARNYENIEFSPSCSETFSTSYNTGQRYLVIFRRDANEYCWRAMSMTQISDQYETSLVGRSWHGESYHWKNINFDGKCFLYMWHMQSTTFAVTFF